MNPKIQEKKFEVWRHGLLDLGKRNRMMNYRKTKRATLQIANPSMNELFQRLVVNDESIAFKKRIDTSNNQRMTGFFYLMDKLDASVELATGEISSDLTLEDMNRTLRQLRAKSKASLEEQGINTLYLSCGFLEWRQKPTEAPILSPLVLIPVTLEISSILEPYKLKRMDEDIVVNPTLEYVLRSDYNVILPEFNSADDDLLEYLQSIQNAVSQSGWRVVCEANLGLLSFLKIVMYKDLDKYKDRIFANPVVQAFCGDPSALPEVKDEWKDYEHDKTSPINTFQVVNADASQQDAILLSKEGVSFVLQGPPGTGKSQTITNIIAEGLADGKKILFVSEKMAALSVVYRRLQEVNLAGYCLSLHNYKAQKKQVINDLVSTLDAPKKKLKAGVSDFLSDLEEEREKLNVYHRELYRKREPLNMTLYEAITELTPLENVPFYRITEDTLDIQEKDYKRRLSLLKKYRDFANHYKGDILENPWQGTSISMVTYDLEDRVSKTVNALSPVLFGISVIVDCINQDFDSKKVWTWSSFEEFINHLNEYRLFKEIAEKINEYYAARVVENASLDNISALGIRYDQVMQQLLKQELSAESVDKEEDRAQLMESIDQWESEVRRFETWMSDINQLLDMDFQASKKGVEELTEFAKLLLSCDIYETHWYESGNYEKDGSLIAKAKEELNRINVARKEQYTFLFSNILATDKNAYLHKSITETAGFYMDHFVEANQFAKELSSALKLLIDSGITIDRVVNTVIRENTLSECQKDKQQVESAEAFLKYIQQAFDYNISIDRSGLNRAEELLQVLNLDNRILRQWIISDNYAHLIQMEAELKRTADQAAELKRALDDEWTADIYSMDVSGMLGRFRTDYTSFFKRLGGTYKQDKRTLAAAKKNLIGKLDDVSCVHMLEQLQNYNDIISSFNALEEEARRLFDDYFNGLSTDWGVLERCLEEGRIANNYYLKYGMSDSLIDICCEAPKERKAHMVGEQPVSQICEQGIISKLIENTEKYSNQNLTSLHIKLDSQIKYLENVISNCRIVEAFIFDEIEHCLTSTLDIGIKDSVNITSYYMYLERFCNTAKMITTYDELVSTIKSYIPSYYDGYDTDWEKVSESWRQAGRYHEYITKHKVSGFIEAAMLTEKPARSGIEVGGTTLLNISEGYGLRQFAQLFARYSGNCVDAYNIIGSLRDTVNQVGILNCEVQGLLPDRNLTKSLEEAMAFLNKYGFVTAQISSLQCQYEKESETVGVPYADVTCTDELFELMDEYIDHDEISDQVIQYMGRFDSMSESLAIDYLYSVLEACQIQQENDNYTMYKSWFNGEICDAMDIHTLAKKVEGCRSIEALDQWLEYCDITKQFQEAEMADYLDYLWTNTVKASRVLPIYKRGFLTKWFYDTLEHNNLTYLIKFQAYAHEKTIQHFTVQDIKQMKLAQARLDEMLSNRKPSGINVMSNAMDEISILRKEAGKKRNIMPLRKLFKVIPTLLLKLKPCFMMSPLSVSYFLDSDMYDFDMVIFDEASQILPEDAIGAIYRGKQVIIAGDTKQMPPTSFFSSTSKNTDDYDVDEDDDVYVDIESESILDEASTCLPSCMLSWHYRSKDESLIAFSNKEIYDNKLITFPNCRKDIDRGLQYIYVPNGYYEGKPKNCNVNEAKRCVRLVEEHIKNHPDRSLGIIAFSEKQQGTIEDAINEWRLKNPVYEEFFDEDKDEPFFVKNLENVQGDERDTIIFSICYARNKQGKMYMRFGPLGRAGGERRLNVAITRAKYNIKLVGSIYPNDLPITESTSLGVQLLAHYISYAMSNDYEAPMGTNEVSTDEVFVDMIADFLMESGYRVRRNIGTSQYKIDIGVIHPDAPNEFFAGIECDSENYVLARTARDRDVTRKNIMDKMGWNMYHVWSLAWYKNPKESKKELLKFLKEAAEKHFKVKSVQHIPDSTSEIEMLEESIDVATMTDATDSTSEVHQLHFAHYKACNPMDSRYVWGDDNYSNIARRIRYVMDFEAPIHKELLYRRLAVIFGRQKATAPVVRTIDDCIARRLSNELILDGDFWYLRKQDRSKIVARVPLSEDDKRSLDQICPEEIQDAMKAILKLAYGLTLEDLIAETARQFGFQRTGPKMKTILESNYEALFLAETIKKSDGKIYLTEGV